MKSENRMIRGAMVVLPDQALKANVYIQGSRIEKITPENTFISTSAGNSDYDVIEAEGMYVLPGLIDIHCDAIEKEVQPRPRTLLPMDFALRELEKKLAACGITTMFHSLSLGVGLSLAGDHLLTELIEQIKRYREKRGMIRHQIHLRYEISHLTGLPLAEKLIESGLIDYLSYMNHAPGQGQYKAPGSFEAYVMKNQGVNREEVTSIIDKLRKRQELIDWRQLKELATRAQTKGIAMASHDDDSAKQIEHALQLGMSVSEFPLNLPTAVQARERGLRVCVGAPNVLRGQSHDNNMRAMDAIEAGAAEILCSDYLPQAMLPSVFKISDSGIPLSKAVNMASLNPARALGIDHLVGSIEAGKSADLLIVEMLDGYPMVRHTIVDGKPVYGAEFYFRHDG